MSKPNKKAEHTVGFGKPPAEHRFKKGQSGNPKGRPRKSRTEPPRFRDGTLDDLLEQEVFRSLQLSENGRPVEMSAAQAIFRSLIVEGLKGNRLAKKYAFEVLRQEEEDRLKRALDHYQHYAQKKAEGEAEIARCEEQGVPPPRRFPHPDDILLDQTNLRVHLLGPLNEDQAIAYERGALLRDWYHARSVFEEKYGEVITIELQGNSSPFSRILAVMTNEALPPSFQRDDHSMVTFGCELRDLTKRQLRQRIKHLKDRIINMPKTIEERLAARERAGNAVGLIGEEIEKVAAELAQRQGLGDETAGPRRRTK